MSESAVAADEGRLGSLFALHEPVLALLEAQRYDLARPLVESLIALGEQSPALHLAHALVLIKTGDAAAAGRILAEMSRLTSQLACPKELTDAIQAVSRMTPEAGPGGSMVYDELPRGWDPAE
jgi:hypothetical protein